MNAVTLLCFECGEPWELPRRQGCYPLRCPRCTRTELTAKLLARRARDQGLTTARAVLHDQHGWVCAARTPWHRGPVILRDEHDVRFLLNELGRRVTAPSIARKAAVA